MLAWSMRLNFAALRERLLETARHKLSNGEFTERGLARSVGLSQPHVHNVLKGTRLLTSAVGDLLLSGLDISLLDVITSGELSQELSRREEETGEARLIPLLYGKLGPGYPFPAPESVRRMIRVPIHQAGPSRGHAFVEIAHDQDLPPELRKAALALLEFDQATRLDPQPDVWYAIRWPHGGCIRQVRRVGNRLELLGQRGLWANQVCPDIIDFGSGPPLQVVRAAVLWAGDLTSGGSDLDQNGLWLREAVRPPCPAAAS